VVPTLVGFPRSGGSPPDRFRTGGEPPERGKPTNVGTTLSMSDLLARCDGSIPHLAMGNGKLEFGSEEGA